MMTNYQLDHKEDISMMSYWKLESFITRKCIWKSCLQNDSHFIQASVKKILYVFLWQEYVMQTSQCNAIIQSLNHIYIHVSPLPRTVTGNGIPAIGVIVQVEYCAYLYQQRLVGLIQSGYLNSWIIQSGGGYSANFSCSNIFPVFQERNIKILATCWISVHNWQVEPQLSCGGTCQIWMWFKESNRYFSKTENFP